MTEKLTELDALKMNLLSERTRRINAESEAIKSVVVRLEQERATLQEEQRKFGEAIKATYGLKEGDQIGMDGTITRAAVKQPTAGPLPSPTQTPPPQPQS